MSVEEMDNLKVDVKPKNKYNYGDKYKGRYKETHHKIYLRKREAMTQDDKDRMKLYKRNYYLQNFDKYKVRSKQGGERVKKALKLLKQVEILEKLEADKLVADILEFEPDKIELETDKANVEVDILL